MGAICINSFVYLFFYLFIYCFTYLFLFFYRVLLTFTIFPRKKTPWCSSHSLTWQHVNIGKQNLQADFKLVGLSDLNYMTSEEPISAKLSREWPWQSAGVVSSFCFRVEKLLILIMKDLESCDLDEAHDMPKLFNPSVCVCVCVCAFLF